MFAIFQTIVFAETEYPADYAELRKTFESISNPHQVNALVGGYVFTNAQSLERDVFLLIVEDLRPTWRNSNLRRGLELIWARARGVNYNPNLPWNIRNGIVIAMTSFIPAASIPLIKLFIEYPFGSAAASVIALSGGYVGGALGFAAGTYGGIPQSSKDTRRGMIRGFLVGSVVTAASLGCSAALRALGWVP